MNLVLPPFDRADSAGMLVRLQANLDPATLHAAWDAGRKMNLDEALAMGLENQAVVNPPPLD